jgi:magnesium transporter
MIGESSSTPGSQTISANGCTWVSVEHPIDAEIGALAHEFQVARGDLELALAGSESGGVWRRDHYVLMAFQVPLASTGRRPGPLRPRPVTLLAGRDFLITVHTGDVRPLLRLFRQCETDERAREAAFGVGVAGLVFVVVQRLLDATAAVQTGLERELVELDDVERELADERAIAQLLQVRSNTRSLWRLAEAWPRQVREVAAVEPISTGGEEAWFRVERQVERLRARLEDDLAALDGLLLAATATATLRNGRSLRALAAIAALTLPVIAVATLAALPLGSPLATAPHGYTIALALAGLVFLAALLALRRSGYL